MSQDKKYQVFISSTYTDLIEAREKATKVILDLYHLPVGMEMFSADDDDQWKIITDAIDVSDYYVLIIGHRYGSLTNKGISYTEKEFNYAKSKKIPIISFIRDRNVAVSNSDRETVPDSLIKLDKFIEKAKNGKMCAFWNDVSDLERQIAVALPKSFARHKGVGWVRGDTKSEHIAEEIAKLSEENRKLREENEALKKNTVTRKPLLNIFLNDKLIDEEIDSKKIIVKLPVLDESSKFKIPEKRYSFNPSGQLIGRSVTQMAVNLLKGSQIPESYFEEYNADIEAINETQISAHNLCLQMLQPIKLGLYNLEIIIKNIGTSLATNVCLEISFPSFVKVIDDNDDEDIASYKKRFSENLIKIKTPEHRAEEYYEVNWDDEPKAYIPKKLNLNNQPVTDSVECNIISININKLLHSKKEIFEDYYLYPVEKGTGLIKIDLICAELSEPLVFNVPITVE